MARLTKKLIIDMAENYARRRCCFKLSDFVKSVAEATGKPYFDIRDKVRTILTDAGWTIS